MRAVQKSARTYKINMRAHIKMQRNYILNVRTSENMIHWRASIFGPDTRSSAARGAEISPAWLYQGSNCQIYKLQLAPLMAAF